MESGVPSTELAGSVSALAKLVEEESRKELRDKVKAVEDEWIKMGNDCNSSDFIVFIHSSRLPLHLFPSISSSPEIQFARFESKDNPRWVCFLKEGWPLALTKERFLALAACRHEAEPRLKEWALEEMFKYGYMPASVERELANAHGLADWSFKYILEKKEEFEGSVFMARIVGTDEGRRRQILQRLKSSKSLFDNKSTTAYFVSLHGQRLTDFEVDFIKTHLNSAPGQPIIAQILARGGATNAYEEFVPLAVGHIEYSSFELLTTRGGPKISNILFECVRREVTQKSEKAWGSWLESLVVLRKSGHLAGQEVDAVMQDVIRGIGCVERKTLLKAGALTMATKGDLILRFFRSFTNPSDMTAEYLWARISSCVRCLGRVDDDHLKPVFEKIFTQQTTGLTRFHILFLGVLAQTQGLPPELGEPISVFIRRGHFSSDLSVQFAAYNALYACGVEHTGNPIGCLPEMVFFYSDKPRHTVWKRIIKMAIEKKPYGSRDIPFFVLLPILNRILQAFARTTLYISDRIYITLQKLEDSGADELDLQLILLLTRLRHFRVQKRATIPQ